MPKSVSQKMADWIKANQGKHVCQCGCGHVFIINRHHRGNGIPKFVHSHSKRVPISTRFWKHIDKKDNGCWEWTGGKGDRGYGKVWLGGCKAAHRVAWELTNGAVPAGLCVLHRCDNPPCVNPAHLFLGTFKDNSDDKFTKGRARILAGEDSTNAKLTEAKVREIRRRYRGGARQIDLAADYHVRQATISAVVRRKTWAHVTDDDLMPGR